MLTASRNQPGRGPEAPKLFLAGGHRHLKLPVKVTDATTTLRIVIWGFDNQEIKILPAKKK